MEEEKDTLLHRVLIVPVSWVLGALIVWLMTVAGLIYLLIG